MAWPTYLVQIVILANEPFELGLNVQDFMGRKLEFYERDTILFEKLQEPHLRGSDGVISYTIQDIRVRGIPVKEGRVEIYGNQVVYVVRG
jgi:hypothetical protein